MKRVCCWSPPWVCWSTSVLAKEIRFATEATYAPFEYLDDKNEFQGFDIDLARAVCAQVKLECSFHNQAFDSLIPSLKFRRYDAAIAAMDVTPERAAQVDFSDIYYENSPSSSPRRTPSRGRKTWWTRPSACRTAPPTSPIWWTTG